jgi:hypothetical protein
MTAEHRPRSGKRLLLDADDLTVDVALDAIRTDLKRLTKQPDEARAAEAHESLRYVVQQTASLATTYLLTHNRAPLRKLQDGISLIFSASSSLPQIEDSTSITGAAARVQGLLANLRSFEQAIASSVPPAGAKAVMLRGQRPDAADWENSLRNSEKLLFFGKDSGGLLRSEDRKKLFVNKLQFYARFAGGVHLRAFGQQCLLY